MTKPKNPPSGHTACDMALRLLGEIHAVEVRTLQGRIDDLREQLRDARARTLPQFAQPAAEEEEEGEGKENPLRKSNPVQWIMDSVEEVVPLGNENARQGLRNWVQRQIRLRGQGSVDEILNEAIQGDVTDEKDDEEVEP